MKTSRKIKNLCWLAKELRYVVILICVCEMHVCVCVHEICTMTTDQPVISVIPPLLDLLTIVIAC